MTSIQRLLVLLFALSAVACSSTHSDASSAPGLSIGEAMQPGQAVRFAVVDAEPAKFFERTLLVEGTVKAVCQKMGCWMQIEDQGRTAMVRWEQGCGGQYTFPKDAAGKRVVLQGSFYPKETSPEDIEHLREEAGGKLELAREGYEFNVSSVRILE